MVLMATIIILKTATVSVAMILEGSTHLKEGVDFDFAIGKVAGSAWWSLNGYQHEGQPANGPVFKAEGSRSEFGCS